MVILDTILHALPGAGSRKSAWGWPIADGSMCWRIFCSKSLKVIFTEFSTNYIPDLVEGDGDVKYHLGYHDRRASSLPARKSRFGSRG